MYIQSTRLGAMARVEETCPIMYTCCINSFIKTRKKIYTQIYYVLIVKYTVPYNTVTQFSTIERYSHLIINNELSN